MNLSDKSLVRYLTAYKTQAFQEGIVFYGKFVSTSNLFAKYSNLFAKGGVLGCSSMIVELKTEEKFVSVKNMNTLEVLEYYITVANKLFCLQLYNIILE